jgi:leucyl-tRNA synthetase
MELVNTMYGIDPEKDDDQKIGVMRFAMESVALLLSPIVPHFAEELWEALGFESSVLLASWPSYREDALLKDELLIVAQVNGKLRSRFHVDVDANDDIIKELALSDERVQKFINNKPIKKVIVVKKKLVNIVV